ncbi:hypothetical protein GC722_15640 [Auraticoccus sp. F435]|uniref:Alpha-galactosidase NEW3 domain-containing protein n=1 Tax=Auraticoccus cholistanensis TaxID=2656650 RepID=A0A6A9UZJ9_9ACTN|nr:NEW3 domain-containing protein [Auraticoccus cholistanensis]MVA77442.1 hypothetical protein [Auraticoccus cholistanensis]
MSPTRRTAARSTAVLAAVLTLLTGLLAAAPAPARAAVAESAVTVSIGDVDLSDGPSIEQVVVTVANGSDRPLRDVTVALSGPRGWNLAPSSVTLRGRVRPGESGTATFTVLVPQAQPGFVVRSFTATVRYTGGDGAGTASATVSQTLGEAAGSLAELYDNVGVTSLATRAAGNLDGGGNSLSGERLAEVGITPGATVSALGAQLTWPTGELGTPDNVSAGGQAVSLSGSGERLVVVGTGIGTSATGTLRVIYTDGTSSSGTVGFPNWCCQAQDAHGATLVASVRGRNTPAGYANADYTYGVFAHSVELDPAKEVQFVVLPSHSGIHVFTLGLAG